MKIRLVHSLCMLSLFSASVAYGGAGDDPFLTSGKLSQFEVRDEDDHDLVVLDGQFWAGHDLNKFWLAAEVERIGGETEEFELQALYGRAISPFWNLQVGARKDFSPDPEREWGVLALHGVAPYYLEVDASLFLGGAGRTSVRVEAEYELLLTQRLILSPEVEINAYGFNDAETGAGSGIGEAEVGLRLRYEIYRKFAPYVGLNWHKKLGETADFARAKGNDIEDTQLVLGIRAWY